MLTSTMHISPQPIYPSLWRYEGPQSDFVVLRTGDSAGMVVHVTKSPDQYNTVGDFSLSWNFADKYFSQFRGEITLRG